MTAHSFVTGGPVPPDSPAYIERDADEKVRRHLLRMEYITLIEPRQQGKTSLIHRLAQTWGPGHIFAYANAMRLDKTDEAAWYASLCRTLLHKMHFIPQADRPHPPHNGSAWGEFMAYLAEQAEAAECNLVIALDELGDVWMDWRIGFFSNIRAIFDERPNEPRFQHLTFMLAGTYNPRALMSDPRTSPFNVAQRVPLPDFTPAQTGRLVTHLGLPAEDAAAVAQRIHHWTDGQPYLTQRLCRTLAEGEAPATPEGVDLAVQRLYREDTNHLPRILEALDPEKQPKLRQYVERVLAGHQPQFRPASEGRYHGPLALIGVLKADNQGLCRVRNRIYEKALESALEHSVHEEGITMSGFKDGYALIIGIANYPRVRKLPEIILKDARDVQDLLRSPAHCGYSAANIRLLRDDEATADGMREGIRWLTRTAGVGDTALVFFSGHGGRVETGPQAGNYLIPYDCDPADLGGTAISGAELTDLLRDIQAQRLLVFFDSCYSGGTGETKGLGPEQTTFKSGLEESYYERLAQGTGRVIMASSRSDEESLVLHGMTNSLLTHYLLEGLRGNMRTRGDGLIRVFDVFDYVSEEVPARGPQHPIFKAADLENNFPLALYLGGKQVEPTVPRRTAVDKRQLRRATTGYFTLEDIAVLCADVEQDLADDGIALQVNLDIVGGISQEAKVLNLIRYLDNRGYLAYLVRTVRRERPGII